jgi:hypothetical protein
MLLRLTLKIKEFGDNERSRTTCKVGDLLACSRIMASKTGLNTVNNSIKCGAVAADGSRAFGRVTILISSISVMSLSGARPSRHQSACEFVEENQQSKRQHRERYEIFSLLLGKQDILVEGDD